MGRDQHRERGGRNQEFLKLMGLKGEGFLLSLYIQFKHKGTIIPWLILSQHHAPPSQIFHPYHLDTTTRSPSPPHVRALPYENHDQTFTWLLPPPPHSSLPHALSSLLLLHPLSDPAWCHLRNAKASLCRLDPAIKLLDLKVGCLVGSSLQTKRITNVPLPTVTAAKSTSRFPQKGVCA